jgi:phospholipid/cholesterol/gamma-HCH transport system substrate-binding protein
MERSRNLVVGAFVLTVFVAFLLWIAVLSGRTGATDPYYSYYDNVTGISDGTQVFFEGYRIGIVESVQPSAGGAGRFRADFSLERGFAIPEDSVAHVRASGLLSAIVVDIEAGESTKVLEPGSEMRGAVAAGMMAALSRVAGDLTELIDDNLAPLLDELTEQAPEIMANANELTAELNEIARRVGALVSPENTGRVERILDNLEGTSAGLASFTEQIQDAERQLEQLLSSTSAMLDENRPNVTQAVLDLRDLLEAMMPRVDAISQNLEMTTRNLNEFSAQVRENPGVIVRGRKSANGDTK